MIRHMRHGSPPRLMVLQSILSPNRRASLPTPSAGDRITPCAHPQCAGEKDLSGGATWDTSGHEDHRTTIPVPTTNDPLASCPDDWNPIYGPSNADGCMFSAI